MQLQDMTLLKTQALINGQWKDAHNQKTRPVTNPANGACLANIPNMGAEETRQAIDAADAALPEWRALTAKARADVLYRWYELMLEHKGDLAAIMTAEQGKPLKEAAGEIQYAASFLQWFAEEAKRVYGATIPAEQADKRISVIKQPIGVTAAITPWNFPAAMITRKAAAALAAGCTMVVKPASDTPLSALALGELALRAGVPAGVLSIVTGTAGPIADTLCSDDRVRKLSFTGSTEIGAQLMEKCAPSIKKLSLELGGNAPFIVFDDADIDAAVEGAIAAKYRNAGQTCVCVNRIYVQSSIYDAFAEKFTQAVSQLRVGLGTDDKVDIGPLINRGAIDKVKAHLDDAKQHGGEILLGGDCPELGENFTQPAVIKHATPAMRIAKEETFGPVAPLFAFNDEAEAIAMANDTEFGLASYFYARDISRVHRVAEALEYGMVGINTGLISTAVAPFGGVKQSGLGREGSQWGLDEYLEMKYLCLAL
ncbi:NAD-dependent succinate-semialdehyde dehydrogenase [Salinivibrio sp. YCSC6]|uniref:NAD-dependent succinate-semialdehyde dehydrogenase n=1 Tax=Salinivibrio sp. YCSC6 TaxID=2003370 RepID=UPI000BBC47D3|nr:NAD-dependent succinate-semialdehyde dehydrogenase [Salinivibrio sp. YCSC6]PCE67370.1 succinate-semialdehyde dehydrogenase (NADP(+)) [Salinivibrio sp. YCSC6]QCF35727.1 NAD-dependent succinate-semialdehyde dehydrogenase [Salinivibrio sp. YCSC6]